MIFEASTCVIKVPISILTPSIMFKKSLEIGSRGRIQNERAKKATNAKHRRERKNNRGDGKGCVI
jgi:hypothetical protein